MKWFCLAIISVGACGESETTIDAPTQVDSPSGPALFSPHVEYAVGAGAISVAIGDVNGDGQPDLVVANSLDDTVSVLLDDGGVFAAQVTYATGPNPELVAIGDLNGDGKPDLAISNFGESSVSVLLNNGDGTFASRIGYPCVPGVGTVSVAIGDVDGDNKPDLIVANFISTSDQHPAASVLFNLGNGSFGAQMPYLTGNATSVAIAEVDGDTHPDLLAVSASGSLVSVLHNSGDGTFTSQGTFATGTGPVSVAVGDLDGDGQPDLATANRGGGSGATVSVLLHDGVGTFAPPVAYGTGSSPTSVAIGDLDGDGKPDLAVANQIDNTASVLLNHGDGTFAAQTTYPSGVESIAVAMGDFDRDGKLDLAVANYTSKTVSVLLHLP